MKYRMSIAALAGFLFFSTVVPTFLYGQIPLAVSEPVTKAQVVEFIEKWRQAWQNKQLDQYIACYAENFQQEEKNLQAWRKHKKYLNTKYKSINITLDEIKIDLQPNGANVQFYQIYKTDKYYEEGYKLLILTYTDEKGWQILREIWLN